MKKFKIEFHIHTNKSKDSALSQIILLIMCKIKKIDCIAITDHNEIEMAKKIKPFFHKKNIEVIIGEEIFTKDGEIIGLYLNEKIEPGLSAEETVKRIQKQNGFVYIPHPYDEKRMKTVISSNALESIKNFVDLIEFHNGRNVNPVFSTKQEKIVDKLGLRKVVGSDAHTFYEIGRNYCLVDSIKKEDLLINLEKAIFVKRNCIKFAHFNTKIVKLFKMILKGDWNGIGRIIKKRFIRSK